MKKVFGIDVSKWQGNFSFSKAKKEGVEFVILRGAIGTKKDPKFEKYYSQAKKEKLNVGVYLYTYAEDISDIKKEVSYLYENCLKGKVFELPIYIDIESKIYRKKSMKRMNTNIVKTFCNYLKDKKYLSGVYSYISFFDNYLFDKELDCERWIAEWSKKCSYKGMIGMWQFGGEINKIRSNKVAGVICDQDYMLIDYPKIIKRDGLNGYKSSTNKQKSVYYTVKKGDNLIKIANKYHTTVTAIVKLNNIRNKDLIQVGERLKVK